MSTDDTVAVDNRWGRLHIQRTKGFPRRYEVSAATRARQRGQALAYVKCPAFNPFNAARFYADEACTQLLFSIRGRWPFLAKNTYTVKTPDGIAAWFDKDLGKSFANAVVHLETAGGVQGVGRDINVAVNKARKVVDFSGLVEFPFLTAKGREILTVHKGWGKLDPYLLSIPRLPDGRQLDWRVASAMAVFLDLSLNRAQF